jgi:hypothetical protein
MKSLCEPWRQRSLTAARGGSLDLDAMALRVRLAQKVVPAPVVVALGVRADGQQVGLDLARLTSEATTAWPGVLEGRRARGLRRRLDDVFLKPIDGETFLLAVDRALEVSQLRRQVGNLDSELLTTLEAAVGDLEVLYRAYGLRGHLKALVERAKADRRFGNGGRRDGLAMALAKRAGRQGIAPQDRSARHPPEP